MRKKTALRVASLAFVVVGAIGASGANAFAASQIQQGDRGAGVSCVQQAMNYLDGAGLSVDGDFGGLTNTAVENFQGSHGLQVDGQVGPLTGASIKENINVRDADMTREGYPDNIYNTWSNACDNLLEG
jgi:peptidoglycan hydrolase-like protein with peptidoglycan-binding domain